MGRSRKVERFELHMPQRHATWIPNVPNGQKISLPGESKHFTVFLRKIKTSSIREWWWWRTIKSKRYTAAYKHMYAVSGSSRHFCTAPRNASGWRSQNQVKAALCQPSLGPPICFPAPKLTRWTLLGEKSTAEVWPLTWPIRLLLQLRYCALNCCAPEDGRWSAKAPQLCRFLSWWMLASWGMVSGLILSKAHEAWADIEEQDGNRRHSGFTR